MPHDRLSVAAFTAIPFDADEGPAGRILRTARELLLARGFSGLTMDALAHDLGMSKKTLYAHFPSKDALVLAIIDVTGRTIRREVDSVLSDANRSFTQKLHGVLGVISRQFTVLRPDFVRDLQRFAPPCFQRLREMREHNMPLVFGKLFRIGIAEGTVRDDLDVGFLVEFWMQAMHGMQQPAVLARSGLTPQETFERGVDLLFLGLLTPLGAAEFRSSSLQGSGIR